MQKLNNPTILVQKDILEICIGGKMLYISIYTIVVDVSISINFICQGGANTYMRLKNTYNKGLVTERKRPIGNFLLFAHKTMLVMSLSFFFVHLDIT
ncbi:hypothetical protein CR513_13511, partial [Mucuna pruriens]